MSPSTVFTRPTAAALAIGVGLAVASTGSLADNFESASYDPATDEIVLVVAYRGTNPGHQFTLQWGDCQVLDDDRREIAGELLDQQALDAAREDFTKTLRFSVAGLQCRPAMATIRTAPRFYVTVPLPARSATTQ